MVDAAAGRTEVSVLFDGSFDGFLNVVYAFYYDKITPIHIQTEEFYQQTIDSEPFYIATDMKKTARVLEGIKNKISNDAAYRLYNASLASDTDYMDMFKYVLLGFKMGEKVDSFLQNDAVRNVHSYARAVGREAHKLSGFCRFAETKQGVYYCVITPINYVLAPLAEHFSDRFMNQNWIIHDKKHGMAAVYNGYEYVIVDAPEHAQMDLTESEEHIQNLWCTFYETIGIKERMSYKRQRQVLPLYFRGNMTEFIRREYAKTAGMKKL
jgi:probable DNA metabolism protein